MLHLHYGRIFSELSAIDNDIGDAVQVLLFIKLNTFIIFVIKKIFYTLENRSLYGYYCFNY